jgi:hypothetical protein
MRRIPLPFTYDDGGRLASGRRGDAGDCVVRAIAIATGQTYSQVYVDLGGFAALAASRRRDPAKRRPRSVRDGVPRQAYDAYLAAIGWVWRPTMAVGSGCQVHLAAGELPQGRLVCRLSGHLTAVVDGVVRDTFDPGRDGTRCVYGYWQMGPVGLTGSAAAWTAQRERSTAVRESIPALALAGDVDVANAGHTGPARARLRRSGPDYV